MIKKKCGASSLQAGAVRKLVCPLALIRPRAVDPAVFVIILVEIALRHGHHEVLTVLLEKHVLTVARAMCVGRSISALAQRADGGLPHHDRKVHTDAGRRMLKQAAVKY